MNTISTTEQIKHDRRLFLGTEVLAAAAAQSLVRSVSAQDSAVIKPRY